MRNGVVKLLAVGCRCPRPFLLPGAAKAPHPNILWLITADFGPHLACSGARRRVGISTHAGSVVRLFPSRRRKEIRVPLCPAVVRISP